MKRHQQILEKLKLEKYVEVSDLCQELQVSSVTIRKDLKLLESKGLLYRTHGGASLENPYINEKPVLEKEKIFITEKNDIASAAAKCILEQDTILIASGTTVQALAREIHPKDKLTVVTSSLNVSLALLKYPNVQIMQLGGFVRHSSSSTIGNYAASILNEISCSKLFLGVDGLDLEYGLTTSSIEEAELNKKMLTSANKTIVLADSSKFGKKGFGKICELKEIDEIITDKGAPLAMIEKIRKLDIKVTIV